ncbi:MurR/RpiR family transcriptional regulator [Caenimonas sedimenti]|uniref:MurR/RpiR family transcriptional regulator n=1 Tax=Caenimonas sedimenti TaxID=2596921 RepID=A0A562ZQH4_9BURK|nr:MurR/RpiR family transcriptional regulator [Caenimonas sedimenti]TWO70601.1 MurR/RpiR family transcriptional regulator [Caenimonas sedimenti]
MQAATNYEDLKGAIASAYPDMSKQLQRIARFALEKPHDLALGTVAAVAEATEVQPSAMIRFANALGYRGFSDMQQVFRGHLVERSASYRERIDQLRVKQLNGQRAPAGVLHQLVGDSIAELGHLEESIPESALRAAVKLIAGAERIHVLAQRRAFPVAAYLAYALGQLELKTHLLDGAGGMLRDNLHAIDKRDVLLVASFRSYSPEVVEAAESCAKRGVAVIAITDSPLSPVVPPAKVCLQLADDSSKAFRSLVGPLCLSQALVMSTGHALAEKTPAKKARP